MIIKVLTQLILLIASFCVIANAAPCDSQFGVAVKPRWIIMTSNLGSDFSMSKAKELFKNTNVFLDEPYGPVLIDVATGTYVVRGFATKEDVAKLMDTTDFIFYFDGVVE